MENAEPQTKATPKRSVWKKIGRFLLFFLLAVVLLVVVLVSGILLYFTPARVEKHVTPLVSEQIQRDFHFSVVHFNIFNGFVFKDITINPPPDSSLDASFPVYSFHADRVALNYSLRHILKRKFIISEIFIDAPTVELHPTVPPPDSLEAEAEPTIEQSVSELSLPIAFDVNTFRLQNAEITVETHDSTTAQYAYISELNLFLDDIRVPQGNVNEQDSLLQGQFRFQCNNSRFEVEQRSPEQVMRGEGVLNALFDLRIRSLQHLQFDVDASLTDVILHQNDSLLFDTQALNLPLNVNLQGDLDGAQGRLNIDPLTFRAQDTEWLRLTLGLDSLFVRPYVDAEIVQSQIPVQQLVHLAGSVLPDTLMPQIYLHNPNAFVSLDGTHVKGSLPDSTLQDTLAVHAVVQVGNLGVTLNRGEFILTDLNIATTADVQMTFAQVPFTSIAVSVDYDSIAMQLPENQNVFSGPAQASLRTTLNEAFLPTDGEISLAINNMMGAVVQSDVSFQAPRALEDIIATMQITIDHLDLSTIPQAQTNTKLTSTVNVNSAGLHSINADMTMNTTSIQLTQNNETLSFQPIQTAMALHAQTDTTFQTWTLDSLSASVNDFFTGRFEGQADLSDQMAGTLTINNMLVHHEPLYNWLPAVFKEELQGLSVSGSTELAANAEVQVSDQDTTYRAAMRLGVNDTNIEWPLQNLLVQNINVESTASLDSSQTGHFDFQLGMDRISLNGSEQTTLQNNEIKLYITLPDFNTIRLDSGNIQLPDLESYGTFQAVVENLDSNPLINAQVEVAQSAVDTIWLASDMFFVGENRMVADVNADTSQASVRLQLITKDLTFSIPDVMSIDRINSDVTVEQNIDLQQGTLMGTSPQVVSTPSNSLIDYYLYRNYYFTKDQPTSRIHIRRVETAGYQVENITLEAFIGMGRIEIPEFSLDAYGGNIGGRFSLAATDQNIMNARYALSAHLAGINSSLLLPLQKAEAKGNITAHAELEGQGFDISNGLDLNGYFTITEIESRVADNLLRSLDPEGKDSGIRSTRILINRGFKPRLFSFDIQNGYSYPAVFFDQPWYFPIRLSGGGIELGRIPLAYFLNVEE